MSRSISHDQAVAQGAEEGRVIIYHRPGCVFCTSMRAMLVGATPAPLWVNIWDDPDAAAYVRSVNGGNETVPTVVIDGEAHTNPSPRMVRAALGGRPEPE